MDMDGIGKRDLLGLQRIIPFSFSVRLDEMDCRIDILMSMWLAFVSFFVLDFSRGEVR